MSVTPTLPSTLLPANAAASAFTVADVAPDQATGFAGILRAAGNRAAGAGVADDSAVADPENGSELPVANATADALAAVEMIAPWIVPLLPTGAVATPASATVGDAVAGAGAQVQLAAMHVSPSPDTPTTVGATAVALTPGAPLPVTALPSASSTVGVMPLTATPVGTTAVASTWFAPRAVDSMPDDSATPVVPPITSAPVASTAATSVPPALTQTTGGEPDRGMGMVAAGEGLELPPVADRIAHAPQAQAALRPTTAPTAPVLSSAYAEADRASSDASSARAEATSALSPASIGSATPPVLRETPAIAQAVDSIVATPGWHEDIAQKLTQFVSLRATTAEIRLNPADLGPIGVTISYTDDQARVTITAAQPATRDALEQALPHLKEMLAQQGITLGEAEVRDRREPMSQWSDTDPRRAFSDRRDDAPGAGAAAPQAALGPARTPRLIDTFA